MRFRDCTIINHVGDSDKKSVRGWNKMIKRITHKRTVLLRLAFFMVIFCMCAGFSSADDVQPALWFMDDLKITQVPGGDYSHAGTLNFDVVGVNNRNIKAPFDGEIVDRFPTESGGNTVVIQSTNKVEYANGTIGYMSLAFGHDNDISDCPVGRKVQQGEVFCQNGNYGNAQGIHSHVTVIAGKYTDNPGFKQVSTGRWTFANAITPEAALFISEETNIIATKGMKFKTYEAKKELKISASGGSVSGAGNYKPGTTVNISAIADEYHSFSNWTSSVDGILANANSSTTTLTMPNSAVNLTANFKLKMGSVTQSWENISANATKNNASLSATLSVDASTMLLGVTYPVSLSNVFLVISPDSNIGGQAVAAITGNLFSINSKNLYFKQFDIPTPSSSSILGGKRYMYTFSMTSTSQLKNSSGTALTLAPSTTYYYAWMGTVNNQTIRTDVKSFTTKAAGTKYETPYIDSNGNFRAWLIYNKSSLSVPEAGIFVGPDENAIKNITVSDSVPNGIEKRTDQNNIDSAYDTGKGGTVIFYKPAGFTKLSFTPGVSYYYKFYSIDADGDVVYSSVERRDIPGTVATYSLTVNAGSGGKITTGTNGSYAPGNVVSLLATPLAGYTFKSWSTTAGSFSSPTNASTSYTMPSQAAIVTAYFQPIDYTLTASSIDGGLVKASKTSGLHYCDTVTLTAIPNTGYTFKGWVSDNGGTFSDSTSSTTVFTMPAGNVSIYADFVKIQYSINVDANYGSVITSADSATMGSTVSLIANEYISSKFVGWLSDDVTFSNSTAKDTTFIMPAKDVSIEAVFEQYNLYEQRDRTITVELPESTEVIYSEAFANTRAKFFVLKNNVRKIESLAFPEGATVFLVDAGSMQIAPDAIHGNGTYVEMSGNFSTSFASSIHGTTNIYCLSNGTIPEEWSNWSDWSEIQIEASSDTEVEVKTQYRSAPVIYSESYSNWSDWSSWSYTKQSITNNAVKEEKTRLVYPYYYFVCPNCGGHSAYWGSRTCDLCGKSVNILESSFDIDVDNISVSKSECSKLNSVKYYTTFNGQRYFYWDDGSSPSLQTVKTQYSYRTRTLNSLPSVGAYGDWQDAKIQESNSVSVQTRTVYRYRTKN